VSAGTGEPREGKGQAPAEVLVEGASRLGVSLDRDALEGFMVYLTELRRWGAKMNLTGRVTDRGVVTRHFLDSLSLLPVIRSLGCGKILDMGSGAGFPGLVLKIAEPSLEVTLLDSREKRVFFLRHVIRALGLHGGIEAVHGRAEAVPEGPVEAFDCVTSRAFAPLSRFLPLALPYVRAGGHVIAMKGPGGLEEAGGLTFKGLGGPDIRRVDLPFDGREGVFIIYKRT